MAQEIKNTFLKSKMNKDLDDRILPNGEYRDALNISVGRSEDNDVGALENVIGNSLLTTTKLNIPGLEIIGVKPDDSSERIFVFLTNYTDLDPLNPTPAPVTTSHFLYSYNTTNSQYTKLLEGHFLNFSKTNRIIGINLLENLLFWTDNRNQPRKININLAAGSNSLFNNQQQRTEDAPYYTEEHQISVAKYNPYQAIKLYKRVELVAIGGAGSYFTVAGNRLTELSKYIGGTVLKRQQTNPISGGDYVTVASVRLIGSNTRITVSPALANSIIAGQEIVIISSNMSNESANTEWPGDPNFLEDRFVRFSYRFKYDDNEYSLMAPFTQIAYIPTQKGFFIQGDEEATYQSTVVQFMKNNVQNVNLSVPLPDTATALAKSYKVQEIELLFKEADGTAVKVLESVPVSVVSTQGPYNVYEYEYQSRKPYKTLPEAQTVRVYDKVPIRAFSQETAGNRIIYGNYIDQHTPPDNLNYNCRISKKNTTGIFNNFVEYPNHSVKRNRNYQIGFVLSDKFGRQSPVILSSVDDIGLQEAGFFYSGSSIYSPYDDSMNDTQVMEWVGDSILVNINSQISSVKNNSTGTPGLYAIQQKDTSSGDGYAVTAGDSIINNTYTFTLNSNFSGNENTPKKGNYLRGEFKDFVLVTNVVEPDPGTYGSYIITTLGKVNSSYLYVEPPIDTVPILRFAYIINDLGWYSYKIVVKQTQQEYYNAYLPGFLDGYPISLDNDDSGSPYTNFPTDELGKTAHVVLINDNINKIPRDLSEVGPDQKQYRSSVKLYGRVNNFLTVNNQDPFTQQYFPRVGISANAVDHVASTIASALELKFIPSEIQNSTALYQLNTNPYIARLATSETGSANPLGIKAEGGLMIPALTIYETAAQESLLPIYWETTSEGLIADLNADVLEDFPGATALQPSGWALEEDLAPGTTFTSNIYATSAEGNPLINAIITLESIIRGTTNPIVITNDGIIDIDIPDSTSPDFGSFSLKVGQNNESLVFTENSPDIDRFTVEIKVIADGVTSFFIIQDFLGNNEPFIKNYEASIVESFSPIIVPARPFTNINIKNGAQNDDSQTEDIIFFMEDNPSGWDINETNGEITQTPFSTVEGVYTFFIGVKDANGVGTQSLPDKTAVTVTIRPPSVNDNIIPDTCFVKLDNTEDADDNGCITSKLNPVPASGIWYIGNTEIDNVVFNSIAEGTSFAKFRIGTEGHTRGVLSFTYNLHRGIDDPTGESLEVDMLVDKVQFYYRIAGSNNESWLQLPRENDTYNNTSTTADVGNISPGNIPINSNDNRQDSPSIGTSNSMWTVVGSQDPNSGEINRIYATGIRVSDYNSYTQIDEGATVEYAIFIKNLRPSEIGNVTNFEQCAPYAFITVEDINYTKCLPINGINGIGADQPTYDNLDDKYVFQYFRSDETEIEKWAEKFPIFDEISFQPLHEPLYSNIAHPEFVNEFFTNVDLTEVYVPSGAISKAISYVGVIPPPLEWDPADPGNEPFYFQDIPPYSWFTSGIGNSAVTTTLTWSAQFANNYSGVVDGKKLFPLADSDTTGVGSAQVSFNEVDSGVNLHQKKFGTTRFGNRYNVT